MSLLNNTGNDFPLLIQMLISCNDAEELKTCKMTVAKALPVGTTVAEFNTIPQGISYDSSITNTSHSRNDYSLIQMLLSCNDIEQLKACKMVMDLKPDTTTNSYDSPSASVLGDNSNRKPSPTEGQNDMSAHTGRTCVTLSEHSDESMDYLLEPLDYRLEPLDYRLEPPSESVLDRLSTKYKRSPDLFPINEAPNMFDFPKYYTIHDLPGYAIVIGSKAKSIFDIGASPMYRVLRSTKHTPLEVLYYKLICHFQEEQKLQSNTYGYNVPIREDQLLFVQAKKEKSVEPNQPDYYIFYPIQHDRDKIILDDIKTDRTSVKPTFDEYIEFLYIETQIKRRVLLGMSMLPVHPKYKAYGPTVWKVLESIDVAINNGIANMTEYEKHMFMLKNVWDLYFSSHPKPEPTIKRKIQSVMDSDNDDHSLTDTYMGPHSGNGNMPPPYSDTSGSGTGHFQGGGSYGGGYTRRATTNHEEMCSESDSSERCDESSAESYLSPWKYISNDDEDDEEDGTSSSGDDDDDDHQNCEGEMGFIACGKSALMTRAATIEDRNRTHGDTIVSANEILDKNSVRSLFEKLPAKDIRAESPPFVDTDNEDRSESSRKLDAEDKPVDASGISELTDPHGSTYLHAAQNGDLDKVKECMDNGVDKEAKDSFGMTALHHASSNGKLEIVQYLIEACGVDKDAKAKNGSTELHYASENGHLEIVQFLIETCQVDKEAKDNRGSTALHYAIVNGHLEIVQYLIENGQVDKDAKTNNGWTTMLLYASSYGKLEIVQYLVETWHVDLEAKGFFFESTALHCASRNGSLEIVQYLIESCHADKEAKDNNGRTALHEASSCGHLKIVQYLIESCHVDMETKDGYGQTAYDCSLHQKQSSVIQYLGKLSADKITNNASVEEVKGHTAVVATANSPTMLNQNPDEPSL